MKTMRRLLAVLTAICTVLLLLPAVALTASAETENVLYYAIMETGEAIITKYDGHAESVVIPDRIEDCPVTEIYSSAFANNEELREVQIPETVQVIGYSAFANCKQLQSVTLSANVRDVKSNSFSSCKALTAITVDDANPFYTDDEGVLLTVDRTSLVCCPAGKSGEYIAPDELETVEEAAFQDCEKLTRIVFSDGLQTIETLAFYGCFALDDVVLPDSVSTIGYGAFWGTGYMESSKKWTGNVLYIGNHLVAAKDMSGEDFIVPDTVVTIGDSALFNCGVNSVFVPYTVRNINESALVGDGLTIIGETGSLAQQYAEQHGYTFVAKDPAIGDFDRDGDLSMKDALLLYQVVAGQEMLAHYNVRWADLNGDAQTDLRDALMLYCDAAGLIS